MADTQKEQILKLLREKSVMKQDVYRNTRSTFEMLKTVIVRIVEDLKTEAHAIDKRIAVECKVTSENEIELKVAGDVLVFYMHTNVFEFDKNHPMYKTGYVKENELNTYCGIIYVYNFLADSFKYSRLNDLGYLISRIFVNREQRFFLESRPPLAYKYANFSTEAINEIHLLDIVNELIIHAISFDLFTPPAEAVREISVNEIQEKIQSDRLKTGKRLGYQFMAEGKSGDEINW